MPDNIYPDLSNDRFDIKYARLMGLSSDLRSSFGVFSEEAGTAAPPDGLPFETPSDVDTGIVRFAVAGEDDTATENRSFDLNGGYSFAISQLGNNQFLVDPPNGLYQLGAVPVPGSDSGLSYTYLQIDDTTRQITLQAAEGIVLPGYGVGVHVDAPAYALGVDASGNIIEFTPGGGTVTADNGLTMSTATNVQLGGTLIQNTSVVDAGFTMVFSNNTVTTALEGNNSSAGIGVTGQSSSGYGVFGFSTTGTPGLFTTNPPSTDTVVTLLQVTRNTSGANGADGIGGSIDFYVESSTTTQLSNQIISKWSTAANPSRVSQLILTGVDNAITADLFTLNGSGQVQLNNYGINTFAGTPAYALGVDASGNVVEFAAGAGSITANNGLTMSTATNVQLGAATAGTSDQPLLHDTYINANTFKLIIGTATSEVLTVQSNTVGNVATIQNSGNGNALFAITLGGMALVAQSTYSSTNSVAEVMRLNRFSSGGAGANGIGSKILFNNESSTSTSRNTAFIAATLTTATDASRAGALRFTTFNVADEIEKLSLFAQYTALTETTATAFLRVNVPTSQAVGGEIVVTVEANDATDFQARTLRFIFSAVNKGGTTTVNISTPEEVVAVSTGTLTVTITAVDSGSGNVDFKADATSSLTQTTLRANCHILKNFGTGAVTPQ